MLHNAWLKFHQQSGQQVIRIVSKLCRFSGNLLVINSTFLSTASMKVRSWQTKRLKLVVSKEVQKYLIYINETISGIIQQVWGFFLQCISQLHFTKHFFHSFTKQWTKCLVTYSFERPHWSSKFTLSPKELFKNGFCRFVKRLSPLFCNIPCSAYTTNKLLHV